MFVISITGKFSLYSVLIPQTHKRLTIMVKKIVKWVGVLVGVLILAAVGFYAVAHVNTDSRINKVYAVTVQPLTIPTDSAAYALGKHVSEIRGCMGCHGNNLAGGRAFVDETTPIGILYASNITSGKGGLTYTDQDWVRTLRHGLGKDGKPLWFMPSHEICHISNQEMAALIGYVKKQPPVDKTVLAKSIKPLGRVLTFLGEFPLLPAEKINHEASYPETMRIAANVTSGEYLATSCQGCHGPQLKGGPAHAPDQPPIPDISSTGHLGMWKADGFVSLFHTGKTPDGKVLSQYMPVKDFTYSDDELRAIYLYLHQVQ